MFRLSLFAAIFLAASTARAEAEAAIADTRESEPESRKPPKVAPLQTPITSTQSEHWRPEWRRYGETDLTVTALLASSVAVGYATLSPERTGLRGGVLFDDAARDWLRAGSEGTRMRAQDASYIFQNALAVAPFADNAYALIVRDRDVALQMLAINVQSYLVTALATIITKNVVSRERPYAEECVGRCGAKARNQSFISGHAAAGFTGAGLVCAHHQALELFGHPALDYGTCAFALAAATVGSSLRVVSDEHHATDVLAGAVVGLAAGYVIPRLIYYVTGE